MRIQQQRKRSAGQRMECPECSKSLMIMHKRTLLVSMKYHCPGCGAAIETTPPRDPPSQPTAPPTGGTSPTQFLLYSEMVKQFAPARKAA